MEYKISKYTYQFISSKNEYLLYSSLSNSFFKLTWELYEFLKLCKENSTLINEIDDELLVLLKEYKMVVSEDEDHDFLLKHQFEEDQTTYSSSSLGLVLVPTMACNFNCPYCFEIGKKAKKMNNSVIENLMFFIKKHKEAKKLDITWYGGEPLLAFDIIQKILNKIKLEISVPLNRHSIITNGFYFNQEVINFFKEHPLDAIQITLDGNKKRHDIIRKQKNTGEGSFDRLIYNMDSIVKELPNTKLSVRINIEKENIQDYFDLQAELSTRWKGYKVNIYPGFLRIDNEGGTALACNAIDRWEAHELYFELRKDKKLKEPIYPMLYSGRGCCATVINSYIIGVDGEIYKCWNDVSDESKIIGYINQENLTNPFLFYRYVVGSKWYHNNECIGCFYLPICRGTCAYYRLRNQYENGQYLLCQCMHKTPDMLNKCLEYWCDNQMNK